MRGFKDKRFHEIADLVRCANPNFLPPGRWATAFAGTAERAFDALGAEAQWALSEDASSAAAKRAAAQRLADSTRVSVLVDELLAGTWRSDGAPAAGDGGDLVRKRRARVRAWDWVCLVDLLCAPASPAPLPCALSWRR